MSPILETIHGLELYQQWRSADDERTFDETGLTPRSVTENIDNALAILRRAHGVATMTNSQMRLKFGELTADEIRLIRAVAAYVNGEPMPFFREVKQ